MAYNEQLAERVRKSLAAFPECDIAEKKMFGGLAFVVGGKMCIYVSGTKLMCRFDPVREKEVLGKTGYLPLVIRGRTYRGYCYVEAIGFSADREFNN